MTDEEAFFILHEARNNTDDDDLRQAALLVEDHICSLVIGFARTIKDPTITSAGKLQAIKDDIRNANLWS